MSCQTDRCKAIKKFVTPLLANQPATSWTVSELVNSNDITVVVGLPNDRRCLTLNPGGTELDDGMKERIRAWLQENVV